MVLTGKRLGGKDSKQICCHGKISVIGRYRSDMIPLMEGHSWNKNREIIFQSVTN